MRLTQIFFKNTNRKKMLGYIFLFFLLIYGTIMFLITDTVSIERLYPTPSASFIELWSIDGIKSPYITIAQRHEFFIQVVDNNLMILSTHPGSTLKKIDLLTGNIIWETPLPAYVDAMTNDFQHVYVSWYLGTSYKRPSDATCEIEFWEPRCDAIQIESYNIEAGDLAWSRIYTGMVTIDHMLVDTSLIRLIGTGGKGAYEADFTIDTITGDYASPVNIMQSDYEDVFALKNIGLVDVVSNISSSNGIIFYITKDGVLWAIEEKTNVIVGTVSFEPKEYPLKQNDGYKIVVENNIVVVYLHKSQQLFAFQLLKGNGDDE